MSQKTENLAAIYQNYFRALRRGDHRSARRWAEMAVACAPEKEEPWLYLAAVASPRASLHYLNQALRIHPSSQRARQGVHWAITRLRKSQGNITRSFPIIPRSIPTQNLVRSQKGISGVGIFNLAIIFVLILISSGRLISSSLAKENDFSSQQNILAQVNLGKATRTPTFTATFTPTSTPTETPTFTPTLTPTLTPTITDTPVPPPTDTPEPPQDDEPSISGLPEGVDENERWIDINLSEQRTYAYEGTRLVNSFVVSTGTWRYPTVTGTYSIYVKYRSADMSGPGYYLPAVPYVMYFYRGYGLHGTYWHNNFGTPMSHGCVNLRTEDAGWLFDWADVGTVVNIHY